MLYPDEPGNAGGLPRRQVGIAAAAVGAVLVLVLVVVAVTRSGGGDGGSGGPEVAAVTQTVTASPPVASAPGVAPSSSAPSPGPSPGVTGSPSATTPVRRWAGVLTVEGPSSRRDLDAVPPSTSTHAGTPDIRGDWLRTILKGESDARLAVLEPGARPDARACQDAAAATGTTDQTDPLDEGDVVCVITAGGHRVARLVTVLATQTSTTPKLSFDAVLWDV
ncbi:hypothetical protein [Actinomadura terrae]|uniref:hypothetical protein n=1 Tax=Actinomadura terrae TaxID=604353 RepID=UPI001FA6FD56|nr:hypothetical protein [Actinomadura terrae]